jgi:hypothetical protein
MSTEMLLLGAGASVEAGTLDAKTVRGHRALRHRLRESTTQGVACGGLISPLFRRLRSAVTVEVQNRRNALDGLIESPADQVSTSG